MGTKRKFFLLLLSVTVLLGTAIVFDLGTHATAIDQLKRILLDATESNPLDSLPFLATRLLAILDMSSFLYGGISLFAVIMIVLVLRAAGDGELKALKSKVNNLMGQLSEADAARIEIERSLNEEIRYKSELLQEKDSMVAEVEGSLRRVHALTAQLRETQEVLFATDTELRTRRSEVSDLTRHLTEAIAAKERWEASFREELAKGADGVLPNNVAHGELLESLKSRINVLEKQLGETRELLKGKDMEVSTLKSEVGGLTRELAETVAAKEQSESELRQKLEQLRTGLQAKNATMKELEARLDFATLASETQLAEKDNLLEKRDATLKTLRSEVADIARQFSATGTEKEPMKIYLLEECNDSQQETGVTGSAIKESDDDSLVGKIHALEIELTERDSLIKLRDEQIEKLRQDIQESKSLFDAAENQVWYSIGRRIQWREKIAKFGLHL